MVEKEELQSMSLETIKKLPEQEIQELGLSQIKGLSKEKTDYIDKIQTKKHKENAERIQEKKKEATETGLSEFKEEVENDLSRKITIGSDTVEMSLDLPGDTEDRFYEVMKKIQKDQTKTLKDQKNLIFNLLGKMMHTEPYDDPRYWEEEMGNKSMTFITQAIKKLVAKYTKKGEDIENFQKRNRAGI